jgi:hypothetical protein
MRRSSQFSQKAPPCGRGLPLCAAPGLTPRHLFGAGRAGRRGWGGRGWIRASPLPHHGRRAASGAGVGDAAARATRPALFAQDHGVVVAQEGAAGVAEAERSFLRDGRRRAVRVPAGVPGGERGSPWKADADTSEGALNE